MNSFNLVYQDIILVSDTKLFTSYILFITHHLTLTMRCHGNGKLKLQRVYQINVRLVGFSFVA